MHTRRERPAGAGDSPVWSALLALRERGPAPGASLGYATGRGLFATATGAADALFSCDPAGAWQPAAPLAGSERELAALYLPVATAVGSRCYVVGHLGQSLDGRIATRSGDSDFVTGPENIDHLHRMRALCKALIVGAGTIAADDPALTTRRVTGPSPVRVVLDPQRRLGPHHRVFEDRRADTWLVCAASQASAAPPPHVRVVGIPLARGRLALDVLLAELYAAGLDTVFVEGGGVTVSRFLEANLLDRLQIAIAPLLIGDGPPGLSVAGHDSLAACLRPRCRVFTMGRDVLFDCEPKQAR